MQCIPPPGIEIEFRPDLPLVEEDLEMTAFHEAGHLLEKQVLGTKPFGWGSELMEHFWNLDRRSKALDQRMEELRRKGVIIESDNDKRPFSKTLFNIVTESYYGIAGGHPYQNPSELFASTLTVLHYFPKSFIASVNRLEQEDGQAMIALARDIINMIKNKTDNPQGVEKLFNKELLDFIYQ